MSISSLLQRGKCSMTILLLLMTVLMLPISSQTSLTSSGNPSCFENDFYDCSVCSCGLDEPIHHTFIFIFHLISFIISFLFILAFVSIQGLRRHPGSIVVALTFANLIYSLETLITSFNNILNSPTQMKDDTLCLTFGYINFTSLCMTYLYQVSFFGFYTFVKHQQRASRALNYEYHIVPIALTIFIVVYLYSQNGFGKTIGGGCSVKSSSSIATPIVGFSILIVISISLLYFMRKIFAGENHVARSIIRATSRYSKYLLITCFVYLVICIITTAMAICVGMYDPNDQNSLIGSLDTLEVFVNLFQVINPLLVMVAWLRDPKSYEPLQRYLGECRWINWLWTIKSSYTMGDLMDEEEAQRLDRHLLNDGSGEGEAVHVAGENLRQQVDMSSKEHRLNVIFTILVSVRYYWHIQKQRRQEAGDIQREIEVDQQSYYRREARNKTSFHINTANMQREIPRVLGAVIPQNQRITQGILTVYAMNLFGEIINLDEAGKYIQLSLDVGKNLSAVTKTGINPKGTNTAFNFMSADNKIIFRSITENELNTLLRILPYFVGHLKSNQNSLIAKIYGAFTYEVGIPYQKLHFIAIRNINKHPPHSIERTYELKGTARFRRTVMEDNMDKSELRHCGILKDFDFNNFEKSIKVGSENQPKLLNILKRDIHFLVSQDLIDYSLSLFMVNRGRLPSVLSDVTEAAEQLEESFPGGDKLWRGESVISRDSQSLDVGDGARRNNPYSEIESSDEEIRYVIGIIDYLNEYNTKKKINILLRRWGLNHSHDDLTSEDPLTYGRRFTDYLEKVVES